METRKSMDGGKRATILVVDDESTILSLFRRALAPTYHVLTAESGARALEIAGTNHVDLVLLDLILPDANGLDLLSTLREANPGCEIIMATAVSEIHTAVKAIKLGAYEYIVKPFDVPDVIALIEKALDRRDLVKEVSYLREELQRHHLFEEMVGEDPKMVAVFDLIATVAESDGAVLIQGESGTGKELVARAIHNLSPRKGHPFVVVNCAAIPHNLMESGIFGHHKGAFTGATQTTMGKLELAHGGTVFLDDIDTLHVALQAKLLRAIQEKEFERVGNPKVIRVDVRFVAASNKDLQELIAGGAFRQDLFYRLNVFPLKLPPLRSRRGDIPRLLNHFLEKQARRTGRLPKKFSERALGTLTQYSWPGNVRELQNLVERLSTIQKGPIIHLKDICLFDLPGTGEGNNPTTLKDAVKAFERQYIGEVLETVQGNRRKASEILGIHRNSLLSKINALGL